MEIKLFLAIINQTHKKVGDLLGTDAKAHSIKHNFIKKGADAVNLPSILKNKSVIETVPSYFKEK